MPWVSGYSGRVTVGGTQLSATAWTVEWASDIIDVTTFKGEGWGAYQDGVPDYSFRVDAFWDTEENPFADVGGLGIQPGEGISLVLYVDPDLLDQRFNFPYALITDVTNEQSVRDVVRYTFVGKASAYDTSANVKVPGEA